MGKKSKRSSKKSNKRSERKEPVVKEESVKENFENGFSLTIGNNACKGDLKNISIEDFSINTVKKPLFVNANLKISYGQKYGFVGPNGRGKTTIMNHISQRILTILRHLSTA